MPSTPSTPATPHRRRSVGIRRPRVAGRTEATGPVPSGSEDVPADGAGPGRVGLLKRGVKEPQPATPATATPATATPTTAAAETAAAETAAGTAAAVTAAGTAAPDIAAGTAAVARTAVPTTAAGTAAAPETTAAADDTAVHETAGPALADPSAADPSAADPSAADPSGADPSVAGDGGGSRPVGKRGTGARIRRPRAGERPVRRRVPTLVLVGLLVVLTAAAVFFGIATAALRGTPAAQNTALVDVGATAQATQQLGDAVKTVYSYDFARLDQNEAAARAVILPGFEAQYDQLFGQVRKIAPQQQAVVTATIATSAVREIDGDRAVVVVFLDQQVTRAQAGDQPQQLAAAGRLTVTGQLVDGTWKIADVQAE